MSSVSGIDGVCKVCGADQQEYRNQQAEPKSEINFYYDCKTDENYWRCLACGYGWNIEAIEVPNGRLWQETFYYPMDADGFVNRPGDPMKTMAQRKAEHRAKCAAACAAERAAEQKQDANVKPIPMTESEIQEAMNADPCLLDGEGYE